MELKYIEIFCALVEAKSFSRAAESLCLTQPTVSIHIKTLEEEFGTRLFDRMGRSIRLTQAGETLYRYAKEIIHIKKEAQQAMEKLSSSLSGRLTIGASTVPGEYILPSMLERFRQKYPEIIPALKIGDSTDIYKSVLEGDVDVGIVGTSIKEPNIVSKKFLDDELVLVASSEFAGSAIDKTSLREAPLLIREAGSGSRATLERHLGSAGLKIEDLRIVGEIGSSQALIEAVRAGMGMAFVSRISVMRDLEQKVLKVVAFKGAAVKRNFHIITHRLRYRSLKCKSFIDFLLSENR